jgi:hypothetical protein
MKIPNFSALLFSGLLLSLYACNQKSNETATNLSEKEDIIEQKVSLSPFPESTEFNDAILSNMTYQSGKIKYDITSDTYQLGNQTPDAGSKMCANSDKGQHIHLIVDNTPYAAKYESSFDYDIADGDHYILSFLSRSYHESIKSPTSYLASKVAIADKSMTASSPVTESMLFYSRPKGTYVGEDTKKVMLDYFMVNPAEGQYVIADINGKKFDLKTWRPYYIDGLPMGENTIELSLVDSTGKLVNTPLNPVSRTFSLQADPASEITK